MKFGRPFRFGEVVLADVQFTDTFEVKSRPALVLFEEFANIVVASITSNPKMKGVSLSKKEGAITDSIIKMNYIFTISERAVKKRLFSVSEDKKQKVKEELMRRLE